MSGRLDPSDLTWQILEHLQNVREIQKSFCKESLDVQTPQKRLLKNLKLNMTIWSSQAQYDNLKLSSSIWRLDLDVLTNWLPEKKWLKFFGGILCSRAPYDRWHERLAQNSLKIRLRSQNSLNSQNYLFIIFFTILGDKHEVSKKLELDSIAINHFNIDFPFEKVVRG